MEDIHGVDVSWLHHSTRGECLHSAPQLPGPPELRKADPLLPPDHHNRQSPSAPGLSKDAHPHSSPNGHLPEQSPSDGREPPRNERNAPEAAPAVQKPAAQPAAPATPSPAQKTSVKRPTALLNRSSADKLGGGPPPEGKTISRKNSWISSLSSKFSSQHTPGPPPQAQTQISPANANGVHGPTSSANGALNGIQAAATNGNHGGQEPYVPQHPKTSFITNALRRLSSGGQVGTIGKVSAHGGVCPRKVMNLDPNRNRCLVPELEPSKLRRVAFCVDVEIAGGPKYKDDEDAEDKKKKRQTGKVKERGEGEALKNPEAVADDKEKNGAVRVCSTEEKVGTEDAPNPEGTVVDEEKKETTRKKEKKKRSEAERKERKEKKRRKAEENGSIPLELTRDGDDRSADGTDTTSKTPPRHQDRPTTDPLRIYRRCCQLRETPILKRISDQLSSPSACALVAPGVVTCLDLTGSRLQLADVVTLSDWLAVVPVKKLFLEDADMTDEKVRVVLAGLLAARTPRRHPSTPAERSGLVKKLVLKNNPKITAEGWKHVALFIYMCRSIRALDISMVPFPASRKIQSPQTTTSAQNGASAVERPSNDIADIISKAIAERLGGSRLEELSMSECGLSSTAIRKIIDGCIMSGIQRLGLAGNDLNAEGLDHVMHYIRSGVCQGLDLGGNDLCESIEKLSACFTKTSPLSALSLADCDLTKDSLRKLFPALVNLSNFRFLDLSHNKDLFAHQSSLCILRKYMPQLTELRRIHLIDLSLSPEDVIGIAEILPECAHIAHVDMLQNPQLMALAAAMDEETQEEAAAMYTSLTMAAKVSRTLICINVDVPSADSNEVVKALAKQVVAYCLRNMENYSDIPELNGTDFDDEDKDVEIPDVLLHLVGHKMGASDVSDNDEPAPDNDYIVGGIGMAKALSYCLSQKATDLRKRSVLASGTATPRSTRGENREELGKARAMSKNLLEYARNIRARLQPAMVRVVREGNDMGYRRLFMLDQTLQGIIQRFEDEYPETRLPTSDAASTNSSVPSISPPTSTVPTTSTGFTEGGADSDEDEPKPVRSRHNSDVNLALRAQTLEEGRVHRLGHRVRTEIYNPSRPTSSQADQANMSGTMDGHDLPEHLLALKEYFSRFSGAELKEMSEGAGWEKVFDTIKENAKELKQMEVENPTEFAQFRETQIAALRNRNTDCGIEDKEGDFAVEDKDGEDCAVED
ncbi:RNI-like protein [Massarina eburnea CBS 473.64]|uniref:RNI-like protein n=1 Tax=Massarina eburnea CBS 473.64 TaxID=1395130 RepID=A0A6A6S890_9PLEO|nr:RNI-like protein [Massarina eburnea CBS 473.64]